MSEVIRLKRPHVARFFKCGICGKDFISNKEGNPVIAYCPGCARNVNRSIARREQNQRRK